MKKPLLLAGLLICLVSAPFTGNAHADTIVTFTLSGSTGLNTGIGSFTVNTTTGIVQSLNFDFIGRNPLETKNAFSPSDVYTPAGYNFTDLFVSYGGGGGVGYSSIDVVVPVATFVGYTGGAICSATSTCGYDSAIYYTSHTNAFQYGQLTAVATTVTPEPSSISYLLLSLACVASVPFLRNRVLQDRT